MGMYVQVEATSHHQFVRLNVEIARKQEQKSVMMVILMEALNVI